MHDRSIRQLVRVYKKALFLCGWNHTTKPSWSTFLSFSAELDRPTFLIHLLFLCRSDSLNQPSSFTLSFSAEWNHLTNRPGSPSLTLQSWNHSTDRPSSPSLSLQSWNHSTDRTGSPSLSLQSWNHSLGFVDHDGMSCFCVVGMVLALCKSMKTI